MWQACRRQAPGCQPGTAAWRWAPSKTTNFMSLIQHFLFVLILSPVLEAHRPNQGWGKGLELWRLRERQRPEDPPL